MSIAHAPGTGLVHEALFYRDADEYVAGIETFLREGLELAEPVLVAVPGSHLDVLRSALGSEAQRARFVDMAKVGRNPGRIIPPVLYAFAQEHPGGRVRIVGEPIWPGRTPAEYRAALQHEALINIALAEQAATILCPYDRWGLADGALADARRTHPVLIEDGLREPSADYCDPRVVADGSYKMLPEPPEWWGDMLVFSSAADLRVVRQFVEGLALRAGLRSGRVSDLCLAVNEVATNTLLHTGEPGILSIWQDPDTECLVCEISDSGQLDNRLVGRIPPAEFEAHGRGLILVNTLCDLVEMPTGRIGAGTTIRLHMALRTP
ncbi:MAG TPA: sensor histidine kinase [Pseudonocardiaceae bacterium]|jgi:anti-sigma regulatory factor (Ser/Thr protein kinase)|nr:sensor histidine kinase [Pseudonocardiaceae bacterium]